MENLGKRVWFGNLTNEDLTLPKSELISAGINYYKNEDEEFLNCEPSSKNWYELCTKTIIIDYINQIIN